jgi:hypothetical protein
MRLRHLWLIATLSASLLSVGVSGFADEKHESHVTLDSIPAPARQAILEEANGAPVLNVEVEKKNGKTLYEAHVKKGDDVIGIVVDADGKLIGKHSEKDEDEGHEHHAK